MLEPWLSARGAAAVRAAWSALSPRRQQVGSSPHRKLSLHGAARLAEAMLGDRADWILDVRRPADYRSNAVVDACYFDDAWDIDEACHETWALWEQRAGDRGVQLANIGVGTIVGRPEGAGHTIVRVFDRDRAASIVIDTVHVSTIGDVELAPVDLLSFSQYFDLEPSGLGLETLRGIIAQLAAELDAHYDTSPSWPSIGDGVVGDGERSISFVHDQQRRDITARVQGLPWGHELVATLRTSSRQHYLHGRLPDADIARVLTRVEAIEKSRRH